MGVSGLLTYLRRKHKYVIRTSLQGIVTSISIDANSWIHNCAQRVHGYGAPKWSDKEVAMQTRRKEYNKTRTEWQLEQELFRRITDGLFNIIREYDVRELLVIAIDGVVNAGKMNQQRYRRYRSGNTKKEKGVFDNTCISPGTPFMFRLDEHIKTWLKSQFRFLPRRVVYSGHLAPGEGEHKILAYMRKPDFYPKTGINIVHGMDNDLVFLSLISPVENIYLGKDKGARDEFASINELKKSLWYQMNKSPTSVNDFVLMAFLFGNDFVPKNMMLKKDTVGAFDALFDAYRELGKSLTDDMGEIDWKNFSEYIAVLNDQQINLLEELSYKSYDNPIEFLQDSMTEDGIDFALYKQLSYEKSLLPKDNSVLQLEVTQRKIALMSREYVTALAWIWQYYTRGPVDEDFFYTYEYAPLLGDTYMAMKLENMGNYHKYRNSRYNVLHQMLTIIPPASKAVLPSCLLPLYRSGNPIEDLQPIFVDANMETIGEGMEHLSYVYVPPMDKERIISAVDLLDLSLGTLSKYKQSEDIYLVKEFKEHEVQVKQLTIQDRIRQAKLEHIAKLKEEDEKQERENLGDYRERKMNPVRGGFNKGKSGPSRSHSRSSSSGSSK